MPLETIGISNGGIRITNVYGVIPYPSIRLETLATKWGWPFKNSRVAVKREGLTIIFRRTAAQIFGAKTTAQCMEGGDYVKSVVNSKQQTKIVSVAGTISLGSHVDMAEVEKLFETKLKRRTLVFKYYTATIIVCANGTVICTGFRNVPLAQRIMLMLKKKLLSTLTITCSAEKPRGLVGG